MGSLAQCFSEIIGNRLLTGDKRAEAFRGRVWVYEKLKLLLRPADTRAVVVYAGAGVGKSSVIAKIIQSLTDEQRSKLGLDLSCLPSGLIRATPGLNVLACYFCQFDNPISLDCVRFIKTIAAMLTKTVPGFHFAPPLGGETIDSYKARLLVSLVECKALELPAATGPHCILVDALDESMIVSGQVPTPASPCDRLFRSR